MRLATVALTLLIAGMLGGCAQQPQNTGYGSSAAPTDKPTPTLPTVRADLATIKGQLATQGRYACCIKSPCNLCALARGDCPCANEVKNGEGVCGECYAGWKAGHGKVQGIDPTKVMLGTGHEPH